MKINFNKQAGGLLVPASDMDAEKMTKFKTGEVYEVEIKRVRNPAFHGKVFSFFTFCFNYWKGDNEFLDEAGQFDVFRKNLTVCAGYYDSFVNLKGETRIEAKSLSYGSMSQEDFETFYTALVNATMKHLFGSADDETFNRLMGFF